MTTGQFKGCEYLQSPNYTEGCDTKNVVVMHSTEGGPDAQEAADWFHNPSAQVSANFVVGQDGKVIQCVKIEDTPWAAPGANRRGGHIEMSGRMLSNPPHGPWTEVQLQTGAEIAAWLLTTWELPLDRVHLLGHVDLPNQTHTDPGPYWDWPAFMKRVAAALNTTLAPSMWVQEQGIRFPAKVPLKFGMKWPTGTNHAYVLANGRFQIYAGPAVSPIELQFQDKGPHTLTVVAYNAASRELGRSDLQINVV